MKINRYTPFNHRRITFYFGIGILLLVAGILLYSPFDKWRYRPNSTFDATRWNKPDLKYRYSVLAAVIGSVIKPGMSEQEVTSLLGTPNAITADEDYQYEVQRPGTGNDNWTGGGLLIKFDRDRHVTEVVDNTLGD